jgi:hypothetical protein
MTTSAAKKLRSDPREKRPGREFFTDGPDGKPTDFGLHDDITQADRDAAKAIRSSFKKRERK